MGIALSLIVFALGGSQHGGLNLMVDLHRKEVVQVDPTFSDDVQVDESKSHVVQKPAVPDDNLDCEGDPIGD